QRCKECNIPPKTLGVSRCPVLACVVMKSCAYNIRTHQTTSGNSNAPVADGRKKPGLNPGFFVGWSGGAGLTNSPAITAAAASKRGKAPCDDSPARERSRASSARLDGI